MLHGGDIYSEGLFKNIELLDYSSNINPLGVPSSFKENIQEAVENLKKYPDIEYRVVKEKLSEYCHLPKEYMVVGNGAAEILDIAIGSCKSALLVVPSFCEYELSLKKWNVPYGYYAMKEIDLDEKMGDFILDYKELLEDFKKYHTLIIGNPNNPNGSAIDIREFMAILEYAEAEKKLIIVDEAFIEFTCDEENQSLTKYTKEYKCLFIVRAMTKFFAMPGIRMGYGCCGNEAYLQDIKKMQNPWNVNCFAEVAVKYCLQDRDYIEKSRQWILKERDHFLNCLRYIDIIEKVYRSKGNFVLVKLKENGNSQELYNKMIEKHVLIRKADNYVGLNDKYLRFAIKDRKTNEVFLEKLKEVIRDEGNSGIIK
ncbi:threonine-phosphate decarboxylase [Hathewaya proteolytica DSM 3090]|uniref:Threonine-phosphate decarboxylase n=1 Tax=Hathewaya proteolytica DSM 3090 TaxID=1121331 RepID=A0A1M6Q505_9CLOT|nr:histidinol-phosphate transaminase [Hathewaya proteolytica]SHK15261.1 threonine-phosphate decarboxylase [Hathewaya proteolytica DSM 3090]